MFLHRVSLGQDLTVDYQISYWLACYPLGKSPPSQPSQAQFRPTCVADVVKSRIQLRKTPPVGTPVQYIAHELKEIVVESRSCAIGSW
jgi:solute carrier family 25 carnitine/acylcarnitine transporter 20/29